MSLADVRRGQRGGHTLAHFADRLLDACGRKGAPACVGFDPQVEHLPAEVRRAHPLADPPGDAEVAAAFRAFGHALIEVIAPLVPAIKINIAFFEPFGGAGVEAYRDLVRAARRQGLVVIGDVKRADIGHSSAAYARAHLSDPQSHGAGEKDRPDAVTVNPYFGLDGVEPFISSAVNHGRGVFVLVATSNPSACTIQQLALAGGGTLCEHVGRTVEQWADQPDLVGASGYSAVGAVVSPRDPATTRRLRALMPHCLFLVPGFGAQGRTETQVSECFDATGVGALVTSSRGIIQAHELDAYRMRHGEDWRACIEDACRDLVSAIHGVTVARAGPPRAGPHGGTASCN
jgi:orotidine-5'-phosphate decarboxylase